MENTNTNKMPHDLNIVYEYYRRLCSGSTKAIDIQAEISVLKKIRKRLKKTLKDKYTDKELATEYGFISVAFCTSSARIANAIFSEDIEIDANFLKEFLETCSYKFSLIADLLRSGVLSVNLEEKG